MPQSQSQTPSQPQSSSPPPLVRSSDMHLSLYLCASPDLHLHTVAIICFTASFKSGLLLARERGRGVGGGNRSGGILGCFVMKNNFASLKWQSRFCFCFFGHLRCRHRSWQPRLLLACPPACLTGYSPAKTLLTILLTSLSLSLPVFFISLFAVFLALLHTFI